MFEHLSSVRFLSAMNEPLPGWSPEVSLEAQHIEVDDTRNAHLIVTARVAVTAAGEDAGIWEVHIPVGAEDLDSTTDQQTLATTLRANLEEWWHTRRSPRGSSVTARQVD